MRILLVEDDGKTAAMVGGVLESRGHKVTICDSIKKILTDDLCSKHNLVILDLILKNERGENLVTKLRKQKVSIPILVISALSEVVTKINLLELGADDYLEKPFNYKELLARVEALKRRCFGDEWEEGEESYGEITFYWKHNEVIRNGIRIPLTKKQGELLYLLVSNHGKTIKSEYILEKIWKIKPGHHSNIVQSMVRRLRKQLDMDFPHKLIRNVHGVGYCLVLPNSKQQSLKNNNTIKKIPKEGFQETEVPVA